MEGLEKGLEFQKGKIKSWTDAWEIANLVARRVDLG